MRHVTIATPEQAATLRERGSSYRFITFSRKLDRDGDVETPERVRCEIIDLKTKKTIVGGDGDTDHSALAAAMLALNDVQSQTPAWELLAERERLKAQLAALEGAASSD